MMFFSNSKSHICMNYTFHHIKTPCDGSSWQDFPIESFSWQFMPHSSQKTCLQIWVGPQINHCKLLMLIFWSGGALFLYIFGLGRLFLSCFLLQHLHCFFPFRFPFQASFGFIFLFPGFFSFDPFFFGRLLLSI